MGRKLDRVRHSAKFGGHPAEDAELEYVVSPFFPELCLVGHSNSEQKKSKLLGHSRYMLRRDHCSGTPDSRDMLRRDTAVAVIAQHLGIISQNLILGGAEEFGRPQPR